MAEDLDRVRPKGRWRPLWAVVLACGCCSAASARVALPAHARPSIASISPNNGPQGGGGLVTIAGRGFTRGAAVSFGPRAASTVRVESSTSIVVPSPPGTGTVAVSVSDGAGRSASTARDRFAYDAAPSGAWLGLNGNSNDPRGAYLGAVGEFALHGIFYDRGNNIEWNAGRLPTEGRWGEGLAASIAAGMIPVVAIEFAGYETGSCTWGHDCLPTGARAQSYVDGFVRSAAAILQRYPGRQILFEPINEPYGYGTAAQYADILARLLPRAERAGIPPASIFAAATGGGWVSAMYAAQRALQTEIAGWYVHPYGPPGGSESRLGGGIESLPLVQGEMTSGQNNVIVSELGFCAHDLPAGDGCPNTSYTARSSAQAAEWLLQALIAAAAYHEQGWLRAVLVYGRGAYQGWGMQFPGGALTQQGQALQAFADLFGASGYLAAAPDAPAVLAPG